MQINFSKIRETWSYFSTEETKFVVNYEGETKTIVEGNSYKTNLIAPVVIKSNESFTINSTQTYTFTTEELNKEQSKIQDMFKNSEKYFEENNIRWQGYLDKTFANIKGNNDKSYKNAAIKSIETLTTNWRSAAGDILHDGVVPSMSYKWFIGMWAWDSGKQAVATAKFDGELAKNNIRALFDYQIKEDDKLRPQGFGTIIDAIFYNKDEARGGDGGMVHELNNSKEEIILAAAWESGMDNAPRFDVGGYGEEDTGIDVFENKSEDGRVLGYSINQESVDLNAYLYAEKGFLKSMAEVLGKTEDAKKYTEEAEFVREYVSKNMFDKESGYFYDLQINEDGSKKKLLVNRGKGSEGWIPLWAKMATKEEADKVVENMLDGNKFNTTVPFGTASQDNPSFSANQYWRGPVWLDQALYGVEALQNYGYYDQAVTSAKKMFNNAEGLMGDGPIRENYNPLTGEGLHTKNFSWSASAYYLMYENTLEGNETTSQKGFAIPTNVEVPGIPEVEVKPEVKPEIKPSKSLPKTGSVVSSGILSAIGVVSAGVGFYLNKKKKNK